MTKDEMRERLVELIDGRQDHGEYSQYEDDEGNYLIDFWVSNEELADHLIANGVRLECMQATSGESKRIEELEAELAEREKVIIQLRKQWKDAEMHICTMCGHFAYKQDGCVIYGSRNCGEITGYPYCAGKFTRWIPVSEPPKEYRDEFDELIPFLVCEKGADYSFRAMYDGKEWGNGLFRVTPTHWMPLPEPPNEVK